MFKNKVLLITGGTGSFGNTVLKRFLSTEVREIRIFSRDEKKQEDFYYQIGEGMRKPSSFLPRREKIKKSIREKFKLCNLYVKNLPDDFNDEALREIFGNEIPIKLSSYGYLYTVDIPQIKKILREYFIEKNVPIPTWPLADLADTIALMIKISKADETEATKARLEKEWVKWKEIGSELSFYDFCKSQLNMA